MKTTLFVIAAFFLLFACDKENESPAVAKKELLAGTDQKSWYIYSLTGDDLCGSSADDSWIFLSTGEFEFNHGTITDDDANGCGDFVNYVGTWELTTGETKLKVVALHEKDNASNVFDITVVDGSIETLTAERLVVVMHDSSTNTDVTLEFRKR